MSIIKSAAAGVEWHLNEREATDGSGELRERHLQAVEFRELLAVAAVALGAGPLGLGGHVLRAPLATSAPAAASAGARGRRGDLLLLRAAALLSLLCQQLFALHVQVYVQCDIYSVRAKNNLFV